MSQRTRRNLLIGLAAIIVIGAGVGAFFWFSGGSGTASVPINAECAPEIINRNAGATVFRITPEESEVRFIIHEDLFGQPNDVVGRTDQVAGDILLNLNDLSKTDVCTVKVDARTLVTDSEFRNRAIRGQILQSAQDQFEFAEFTPTGITGLPDRITIGTPVNFQITGDLKVRDIVNPVTFDVTATLVSNERLEGTATAGVTRTEYNLTIPNAPGVANVADDVRLEIDFVAVPVTSEASQS